MTTPKHDNTDDNDDEEPSTRRRRRCEVSSNTSHLSQFDNSNLYTRQFLYYIFITTCITLEYIMNYLEELKRIKNLTSDLVTHMIVNNPELDQISIQLVKQRAELDQIIDVLECDAGDDNA